MGDRVFADFPYDRRFTKEEIAEITARAEKIADAMRDGVAPNGAILYIDESLLQLWSVHAALAGVYVDDDRAYIVSVKIPDQAGQFADSVEWVMREDLPEDHSETQADAEARQIVNALTERLSPEVKRRVAEQFSTAFTAVNDTDQED
ncbi:phage gene 29 protein family protein [Gordonia sp. KTR9]|uniref:phage gene 29 protein family protein n=1 Tax=Gordonia sp. KTR9 TaxID=337191 RepID=UPI00027DDA0A|nr:hypothetical protein [Gordonia sp. KTR9]AFR48012.1 hypothetical protein KTR9_1372 [Gordonia sp. KTR9]